MDLGLKGKKSLVTGSTRGIGRAIAERLAMEGADVAVCARNAEEVAQTVTALQGMGVQAMGASVDVGDQAALKAWIDAAAGEMGGLDVLVANVSAMGDADWRGSFEIDALINYMSNLAHELAPRGVRVNTVSPGTIYFEGGVWHTRELEAPEISKGALGMNPMGRMGTPEEVANATVFLCSPLASFITGTNLLVDGALTQGVQY